MDNATHATIDDHSVRHFEHMAADWWRPDGPSRALFALNPARLGYIRTQVVRHLACDPSHRQVFAGLTMFDIGCGGGLVSEPLARLGAQVVGIDAAAANIAVAQEHAAASGLTIDYRVTDVETLAATGARADVVVALEVLEHVRDVPLFLNACATLLKPHGIFIFSTPNRTLRSYASIIVAAEYVLRIIPQGTHDWQQFLTPPQVHAACTAAGLQVSDLAGLSYQLSTGQWVLSDDLAISMIGTCVRSKD